MNIRMIGYLLGIILLIEAALLLIPLCVALIFGESVMPFVYTIAGLLAVGLPGMLQKPKNTRFYAREGFICVSASWIIMSLFGALPFVIGGGMNYIDAFFETVSGFTTTGATVLTEIEALPKGILFWRSLTHWVGGMGVLMFMMAILPTENSHAIHLLRAEVPGPTKGKIVPKLRTTALILYGIYVVMTALETIALLIAGLSFYDALVTSLATAGTGGFSVLNASIAGYANPAAEWIIAIFMLLFGVNFNMYFFICIRKFREILKSEELRVYLIICALATGVITVNVFMTNGGTVGKCLRDAFFQVASIISTTGFATIDINALPELSKTVVVLLMICGACAGSTAGGFKISRIMIVVKNAVREIKHMLRPRSVNVIKLEGEVLPEETVRASGNYLGVYLMLIVLSTIVLSADKIGYGLETNLTATLSCLNNIGPFLGQGGGIFTDFSWFSKIFLSFIMLIGRLEIMPMLILITPTAWRRH